MTDPPATRPTLGLVLVTFLLFAALADADNRAAAASVRDRTGMERGSFIDRAGIPLAFTLSQNGRAVRRYADPSLPVITGYRDPSGKWHGLEARYSALLDADSAQRDWRSFFLNLRGQSVEGGSVGLTIDAHLQAVASRALGNARGAVVAIQPQTGAVLALVSKPYCAPLSISQPGGYSACQSDPSAPLFNRATQLLVPPGSAFKIVTLGATLDTGRFVLKSVFSGADAFGPSPYFDNSLYPSNVTRADLTQLTLAQALAFSDNFTFAHIGLTLGTRTLLTYAHRFRVGKTIPFDLPVARSRIANGSAHPSTSVLAQSAFGAAVDRVTPLQMALIAATIANHGTMMAPHLVQTLRLADGRVVWQRRSRVLSRVMRPAAAAQVTAGMEFVVQHGSGFRAQIPGVRVAGKTGTAASGASKPHAWFICFAPAQHPVVAVAVLHEYSGEGFQYAAPVARKVLVAALQEAGLVKYVGPAPRTSG